MFERKSLELRVGDSLRMTKTQKQAGHTAHEQYRVQALRDNGEVVLRSAAGEKVIEPGKVPATFRKSADTHAGHYHGPAAPEIWRNSQQVNPPEFLKEKTEPYEKTRKTGGSDAGHWH